MKTCLIFFKKDAMTIINAAANAQGYALDLRIAEFWWHLITSIWGGKRQGARKTSLCAFRKLVIFNNAV